MSNGWIKLHRKLQECWIWLEKDPFDKRSAWVDLLLTANHSDKKILFNGELITVKRGQILTSIRKLAERWKWSYDKTSRFLKLIESGGMLRKESDNCRTLLTIENYEVYQDVTCTDRTLISEPTEHPQVNLPNTYRTPISEPISDKQECKECKNDKNVKNNMCKKEAQELFEKLWQLYPVKKGKGQVSITAKQRLLKVGYEEIVRAIDRYKAELEKDSSWRKPQNGSTFFNSGYVDYLDANYVPGKTEVAKKKNNFNNFSQRDYDFSELEKKLISNK